jgi:hypothetical protein
MKVNDPAYNGPGGNTGSSASITTIITPGSPVINIAAGTFLNALVLDPVNADVINIGYAPGGSDIEEGLPLQAAVPATIIIAKKFKLAATIYFANITGTITVTQYRL